MSEKVPDPSLRPSSFTLRTGDLLDLDECATDLVTAGYERVDQVDDRGQFAIRGGILDVYPATSDHAVRVDLFDIEIESLRAFSTFTQRSLGELDELEIAPAARAGRRAPRGGRDRRDLRRRGPPRRRAAAAGRPLPRVPGPRPRRRRRDPRRGGRDRPGAARPLAGRLRRVPRRRRPPPLRRPGRRERRAGRPRARAPERAELRPALRFRAQAADPARARCARPSPSSRSSCARATGRS